MKKSKFTEQQIAIADVAWVRAQGLESAGVAVGPRSLARKRRLVEIAAPAFRNRPCWMVSHRGRRSNRAIVAVKRWVIGVMKEALVDRTIP